MSSDDQTGRGTKRKRCSQPRYAASISGLSCQQLYCGLSFERAEDLEQHHRIHLEQELSNLEKTRIKNCTTGGGRTSAALKELRDATLVRLQERRERRRLHATEANSFLINPGVTVCQVCGQDVHGSLEEHAQHVRACIKTPREESDGEDYIELTDYEEYEWAGQSRVRATSLLQGGLGGAGFLTIQKTDETEELDVTGEDPEEDYGPDEYTETCLVTASALSAADDEADDEDERLAAVEEQRLTIHHPDHHDVVAGPSHSKHCKASENYNHKLQSNKSSKYICVNDKESEEDSLSAKNEQEHEGKKENATAQSDKSLPLNNKVAELTSELEQLRRETSCRVCMDPYRKAVVSTSCWHVHCESCWLLALAAKKLCPQCKSIVKPSDLRRIYL